MSDRESVGELREFRLHRLLSHNAMINDFAKSLGATLISTPSVAQLSL